MVYTLVIVDGDEGACIVLGGVKSTCLLRLSIITADQSHDTVRKFDQSPHVPS